MLVYIHRNYNDPDLLRQTPSGNGKWGDIEFTFTQPETCDYIVVLNHPVKDIKTKCRKGGRILLIQEPAYPANNYLTDYFPYFDVAVSDFKNVTVTRNIHTQAALPWLIDKNYDELAVLQSGETTKLDKAGWVTSRSSLHPGHIPRLQLIDLLLNTNNADVDLFGRGIQPIGDKFTGMYPYKYSLAVENYSGTDFWTEKISDAYLSWAMPFYYGCKNIEDYFPENSFVKIDIGKPEEAVEIIHKTIKDKHWDKNLEAIKEARELVLNKYQLFPFVAGLIKELPQDAQMMNAFIPADPYKKSMLKKLIGLLRK